MIPQELTERPQWLAWYYDADGCKIPIGKSNDARTWRRFEDLPPENRAYVISGGDPFCGIDLDDCIDAGGSWTDVALDIMERFRGVAYAEVSPSGTGVKLLTRGQKPATSRCSEGKWLECYDHSRFWTITGNVVSGYEVIGDGQAAIDWLCEKWLSQAPASPMVTRSFTPAASRLHERAQAYVDKADMASEGQRNNTAFRLAGHLRAIADDSGRLSDADVLAYVSQWNSRLPNPLPDSELETVVRSSGINGTARAEKLPEIREVKKCDEIDLSNFMVDLSPPERRPVLDDAILEPTGLLGDMVRFIRQTARYDLPEVALASCLAFAGMILGRRIRGVDDTRPNLYCLSIAESGTGKNHPRQTIKRMMHSAGITIPREGAASATAIARLLAHSPSAVVQIDEAGIAFRQMKNPRSPQAELGGLLSELFTSSNGFFSYRAYADSKNETPVDQPHLSINAITTEQQLYDGGFSHEDIEQGLFGRFLLFRPQNMDPDERFDIEVEAIPASITERIKSWWDYQPWDVVAGANLQPDQPEPMIVPATQGARARYRSYATAITKKMVDEDTFRKAIWRRSKEKTNRLALVHAAMKSGYRDNIVIDKDSMDWAIALCNYSTRGMIYDMDHAMVESAYQANVKYFLSKIPPDGIDKWQLSRKLRKFRPKERDEILSDLLTAGQLVIEEVKTGTKPKSVVRLCTSLL